MIRSTVVSPLAREDNDLLRADNVEAPSDGLLEVRRDYTAVATWTHIFSARVVNQLRVQFADDDYRQISRARRQSTLISIAGLDQLRARLDHSPVGDRSRSATSLRT